MSIVLSIRHYTEYKALYRCPVCFYFTFQAWHFLDLMTSFYTVSQKWFGTLILPHASTYFDNFWQKCCREGNLSSGDFFSKLLKLLMYIKVVVSHISVFFDAQCCNNLYVFVKCRESCVCTAMPAVFFPDHYICKSMLRQNMQTNTERTKLLKRTLHTVLHKRGDTILMVISLSNPKRFSKFFHWPIP